MARIIPSDLTRLVLTGAHGPEIATLAHLRDALPEDYTVFHGVHWTRQYRGHTCYGEIDFVVLNRAGEVLCIEQKNGPLEESQGELFKTYGDTRKSVGAKIPSAPPLPLSEPERGKHRPGSLPGRITHCAPSTASATRSPTSSARP